MRRRSSALAVLTSAAAVVGALLAPGATGAALAAQSGPCAVAPSEIGPIDTDYYLTADGTFQAVVLYVDFPDVPASGTPDVRATTDGVRERLSTLTNGKVDLELTPVPTWFRMPQASTAYPVEEQADADAYLADVVAAADAEVDFSVYDIVYFQAAPGADALSTSHATNRYEDEALVADGVPIRAFVDVGSTVDDPAELYVEHETLHLFGLPDLYSLDDYESGAGDPDRYVGGFDVMALTVRQFELLAWHRWMLGTVADARIVCLPLGEPRELTLDPLPSNGAGPLAFVIPTGTHTRLIGEYRTRDGLDAAACRTGLLLYTVDDRTEQLQGPVRVIDSRPASRPPCANELDDAPFDLERPTYDHPSGARVEVLAMDAAGLKVKITGLAPAPGLTLSPATISAGDVVTARWTGRPGQVVEILSRTQPATAFSVIRTITLDGAGQASTTHRPQRNTRLTGRTQGATARGVEPIIAVRSVASFNANRVGTRTYSFTGRVYPALTDRLVNVYRNGVLVAQARSDAGGIYEVRRTLAAGTFAFQARTPDDQYNLGTTSPTRSVTVR